MKTRIRMTVGALLAVAQWAVGNGGPFVVKYPGGDPAAKGVLARLDATLKPKTEERLKVLYENLTLEWGNERYGFLKKQPEPLVAVKAEYRIANPLNQEVEVDFGFPILRGIYVPPLSMMPTPDARVLVDGKPIRPTIISTSAIYGLIRQQARRVLEEGLAADARLAGLVKDLRASSAAGGEAARAAVVKHLVEKSRWPERDAELLADYGLLNMGTHPPPPVASWMLGGSDPQLYALRTANLGSLSAIGEQKATQLLALLAGRFQPKAVADYEGIFKAWGGDVRERAVDLASGQVRPREIVLNATASNEQEDPFNSSSPTVYARVDYLDPNLKLPEHEKVALQRILKNLPVTFTFAPMNLLHYRVAFKPMSEQTVTVVYQQFAYLDTGKPESYQIAYVIHPASLWKEFGKINLKIVTPENTRLTASVPCARQPGSLTGALGALACYTGEVTDKTGELFIGIDKQSWLKALPAPVKATQAPGRR